MQQIHELVQDPRRRLHPSPAELLASVPLFHNLPELGVKSAQRQGASTSTWRRHRPRGHPGASMFVVLSGILEVRGRSSPTPSGGRVSSPARSRQDVAPLPHARMATVVTLVDSQLADRAAALP